jgi:hypothetical protein
MGGKKGSILGVMKEIITKEGVCSDGRTTLTLTVFLALQRNDVTADDEFPDLGSVLLLL